MNEITKIHLGRQGFTIAADAYKALQAYLRDIKHQVDDDSGDVVDEVELRMAELLTERGISGEKVVLLKDVEYLKAQLGEPREFGDGSDDARHPEHDPAEPTVRRRLFRDTDRAMVAGVASGIAAYLNVDPFFIRLLFVLFAFSGSGILVYLLLWVIIPPAQTNSDRLRMRGKPVTVDNIKQVIDDADVSGTAYRFGRTLAKVAKAFAEIVISVLGVLFVLNALGMLVGAAVSGAYLFVHGFQLGGSNMFPIGAEEILMVVSALAIVGLLAILSALVGRALIRRKWEVPGWLLAALVGVGMLAGTVGTVAGFDRATPLEQRYKAVQHSEWRPLTSFSSADLNLGNVEFDQVFDASPGVEIRALGPVDTHGITTKVVNGKLAVDASAYQPKTACHLVCPYGPANTEVVVHSDKPLEGLGAGDHLQLQVIQDPALPTLPAAPYRSDN